MALSFPVPTKLFRVRRGREDGTASLASRGREGDASGRHPLPTKQGNESGGERDMRDVTRRSIADELRGAGIRPTPQRVAVYEMLKGTTSHPSVDAVYEALKPAFPTLSLNTVYCTLQALVSAGLVRRLAMRENVFRYDANASPHAHFVCTICGRVEDTPREVDEDLAELEPRLEAKIPRLVVDHDHYFYGYCKDCEARFGQMDAADSRRRPGLEERTGKPTKGEE